MAFGRQIQTLGYLQSKGTAVARGAWGGRGGKGFQPTFTLVSLTEMGEKWLQRHRISPTPLLMLLNSEVLKCDPVYRPSLTTSEGPGPRISSSGGPVLAVGSKAATIPVVTGTFTVPRDVAKELSSRTRIAAPVPVKEASHTPHEKALEKSLMDLLKDHRQVCLYPMMSYPMMSYPMMLIPHPLRTHTSLTYTSLTRSYNTLYDDIYLAFNDDMSRSLFLYAYTRALMSLIYSVRLWRLCH